MEKTKNIYEKLLEAQMEIGAIKKDSDNPFFKSKYFDINAVLAVVKPILNKKGLLLTQAVLMNATGDKMGIRTTITNVEDGKEMSAFCDIPTGLDAQKTGSAITYFRRYALQSLLALEAEDDDAETAVEHGKKVAEKVDLSKPPF